MFLPPPNSTAAKLRTQGRCRRKMMLLVADRDLPMGAWAWAAKQAATAAGGTGERRQSTLAECAVDSFGGSMADRRTHHLAAASGASCLVPYRGEQPAASCLRVYCLPHAGGAARLLRPWRSLLPPEIELWGIEYPGHGRRTTESLVDRIDRLGAEVATALAS